MKEKTLNLSIWRYPMLYGDGIRDDTAALQEMLDRRGIVTIDRPGIYLITKTLVIHSNTRFILSPGAVLLAAPMSRCALIEKSGQLRHPDRRCAGLCMP